MSVVGFTNVREDERAQAIATLVSAFTDDPVERWLYPDAQQYLTHFSEFLSALGSKAFAEQTAWGLAKLCAIALWLPWAPSRTATSSTQSWPTASHLRNMGTRFRSCNQ